MSFKVRVLRLYKNVRCKGGRLSVYGFKTYRSVGSESLCGFFEV